MEIIQPLYTLKYRKRLRKIFRPYSHLVENGMQIRFYVRIIVTYRNECRSGPFRNFTERNAYRLNILRFYFAFPTTDPH